jgi:D-proline reductase (dithiol) PrdB
VSLTVRHLEENGIPTVIMGCAKDIVEHCGVPRFVFSDFPLGNSAGKPNDPQSQAATLELAFKVLETAPGPRTTVQSPQRWSDDPEWKLNFQNIERMPEEDIRRRRAEFDKIKQIGQKVRDDTQSTRTDDVDAAE